MVTMTDRRRRLRCTAAAGTGAGCRQCKSDSAIWRLVATTDEADSVESSGATETAATSTEDPLMATAVERNGEVERARRQRRRLSIQHLKTLEEAVVVYRRRCFFGIPMPPFTAGFLKSWKEEEEEERGKEQESNFLPGANGCK